MKKVQSKNGKEVYLLTPAEKKKKYQKELKDGFARTNKGGFKLNSNKKGIKLTQKQKDWRAGYIACSIDSGKAFHSKKNKKRGK